MLAPCWFHGGYVAVCPCRHVAVWPQGGFRLGQVGLMLAPRCLKLPQVGLKLAQVGLKLPPDGLMLVQVGPTWLQLAPTWLNLAPSWLQLGPKLAPSWLKLRPSWLLRRSCRALVALSHAPLRVLEVPLWASGAKRSSIRPQGCQNGFQQPPEAPKIDPKNDQI